MGVNKGVLYAIAAYGMWGFFPLYFKAISQVPPLQILSHRVIWSFVFLAIIVSIRQDWKKLRALATRKVLLTYLIAALLLGVNWFVFIWGVNSGFVVESSLGYFINPLVNVLLGTIFLRERLKPVQWLPIGLAAIGVLYLTLSYGRLPWIALSLALTFGLYGLVKKLAPLNALHGLSLETVILLVPALAYLLVMEKSGTGAFGHLGIGMDLAVAVSGILTALPLLFFAEAAHMIPLTTLGLIQYIAPTFQFLTGVVIYHEPFTEARVIGFSIIWAALILYSASNLFERWRTRRAIAQA
jgi:chloramphenicol-sensitive protein RarD